MEICCGWVDGSELAFAVDVVSLVASSKTLLLVFALLMNVVVILKICLSPSSWKLVIFASCAVVRYKDFRPYTSLDRISAS